MSKKYEVHTSIELRVANFVKANNEREALALTSKLHASELLKQPIIDISTVDVQSAYLINT